MGKNAVADCKEPESVEKALPPLQNLEFSAAEGWATASNATARVGRGTSPLRGLHLVQLSVPQPTEHFPNFGMILPLSQALGYRGFPSPLEGPKPAV